MQRQRSVASANMRMTLQHYVCSTRRKSRWCLGKSKSPFSYGACWPGEWLCVDSNSTDGKPTFHRRANLSWFSRICNHFREIAAWSRKSLTMITVFFWKKYPLRANFQNIIPKGFTKSQNHVLCANFVKFGWPEIGKVMRCLPDKKQKFRKVSRSRLCADGAQNLSGPAPNNILGSSPIFIQIRSLLAELQPNAWTSLIRATKYFQYWANCFFAE